MSAAPKSFPALKSLRGIMRVADLLQAQGKAEVQREETGTSTFGAAGVGDEASSERFASVTSGRSIDQPWVVQAAKIPDRV
jgi:hypothetical protein